MKTILLLISFMFCLWVFASEGNATSLYDRMQKGKELFEQGKFDEALNTFLDAQIEFPEDPDLKYNIASAHYKMKNYEEAVKGYLDVATTAQDVKLEERSLYNIGNAMYRQGKLEDAVGYYRKALELDPEDNEAQQNLEFVLEEIKRRINDAKKTEQQQQQKKNEQKSSDQEQTCQNGQKQKQEQSSEADQNRQKQEQKSEADQNRQKSEQGEKKEEQGQAGTEEAEKREKESEGGQGAPAYAKKMTEEEAEQWLNSTQENRDKFKKKKQKMKGGRPYRSGKDW